jgi:acyl carrier protein
MTKQELRKALLDIISDIAPDEDISNIADETPLRDQIELDSMDFLDIVLELRKRFKIHIPEEEYHNLTTMMSTVEYLLPKMT